MTLNQIQLHKKFEQTVILFWRVAKLGNNNKAEKRDRDASQNNHKTSSEPKNLA